MDSYDITQIAVGLYAVLYVHRFMTCFFAPDERRLPKWGCALLYALYPIFVIAAYFLWNMPVGNLAATLLGLLLVTAQFRAGWQKRLTAVGLIYISMMLIETLCTVLTNYIGGSPFEESTYRDPCGVALSALITHCVAYALYAFRNLRRTVPMPAGVWVTFGIVPAVSFLTILLVGWERQIGQWAALVLILAFMVINGAMLILFDRITAVYQENMRAVLLAQEKESYYQQCRILQESENSARAIRHEVRNQLTLMQEMLRSSATAQVQGCLTRLETALGETGAFSQTGQIALDSILNLKLTQAQLQGISVTCHSQIPEDLCADSSDLMIILGNLLDNATEAAAGTAAPYIRTDVLYDRGMLFVTVENRYSGELLPDGALYRTTKSPHREHGYGLRNVVHTLRRYHGTLELHHTADTFTAQAALYCRSR